MRTFKERLKYYIIGFGIGIIAVFFFFGERGCSWLPENRVKNTIAEKEIIYGDSIKAIMNCQQVTTDEIYNLLNSDGDIDFSSSLPNSTPKQYVFNGPNHLIATFALYDTYSEVMAVSNGKSCSVNETNSNKQLLPLPNDVVRNIIESQDFKYYPAAECLMECFELSKEQIELFHKTASINMSKSNAWPKMPEIDSDQPIEPKIYYMEGKIEGKSFDIVYEIGENRTRIKYIIGDSECDC